MKPTIITLSGKAQHGKTTSCDILEVMLQPARVMRISYGDYVKEIATKHFGWDGKKDEAGRDLLQWLGTDNVRAKNPTFWVNTVVRLVDVIGDEFDYVLIDDARFPDEIDSWKGYAVYAIRVNRPGFENNLTTEQRAHISETALDNASFAYRIDANNIEELMLAMKEIAEGLNEREFGG